MFASGAFVGPGPLTRSSGRWGERSRSNELRGRQATNGRLKPAPGREGWNNLAGRFGAGYRPQDSNKSGGTTQCHTPIRATVSRQSSVPKRRWSWLRSLDGGRSHDHVHALLILPPTLPLARAVQFLKGRSSNWINESQDPFAWQEGYGAFRVSPSQTADLVCYI